MVQAIVIWSAIMALAGIGAAFLAAGKNRDWSAWSAWGIIFPPSVLILALLPYRHGPPPRRPTLDEEDLPS